MLLVLSGACRQSHLADDAPHAACEGMRVSQLLCTARKVDVGLRHLVVRGNRLLEERRDLFGKRWIVL